MARLLTLFLFVTVLMLTAGPVTRANECLELDFEITDTVYTIPGDFFVTGHFELTNCGDEMVRVWLESSSPLETFGQIRGRHNLGAGEMISRRIKFPVPPPVPSGVYTICVTATVGEMVYEACEELVVIQVKPPYGKEEFARLQVIHNAADPAAEMVDVWVNGELFIDDFEFRTATPFVDVPAEVDLTIGVAGPTSTSPDEALATFVFNLAEDETYVAVASGVLDIEGFEANPDGMDIAFNLFAVNGVREMAEDPAEVDFIAFHGATDAQTVDIIADEMVTLVDDLTYGEFSDYVTVSAAEYVLHLTPGDDNQTLIASFEADLSGLGGGAAVVFASGFLTPENNHDGPAFGLFAALPTGDVVEFPAFFGGSAPAAQDEADIVMSNHPNPFNVATQISFSLPQPLEVTLNIYNLLGQRVVTLIGGEMMSAGGHDLTWDGLDSHGLEAASGMYFYRLTAGDISLTKRMLLLK